MRSKGNHEEDEKTAFRMKENIHKWSNCQGINLKKYTGSSFSSIKKQPSQKTGLCRHRPIFPGGCPPSIFGTNELNYCVRNGNRWILAVINTDYWLRKTLKTEKDACERISCSRRERKIIGKRSSPRPISTRKLNVSLRLHIEPINLVVYKGSYLLKAMGYLILGTASRLDAFSVYPIRT